MTEVKEAITVREVKQAPPDALDTSGNVAVEEIARADWLFIHGKPRCCSEGVLRGSRTAGRELET
jgi:hypothetical protein